MPTDLKERIEKESGVKLNDFPESDFEKIEKMLANNDKEVEVWLMKGMGRYYIVGTAPGENNSSLPIQRKLCEITKQP